MAQIAGGSIGLGLNTALVVTAASLPEGIAVAFKVDAALAIAGLVVVDLLHRRQGRPRAPRRL